MRGDPDILPLPSRSWGEVDKNEFTYLEAEVAGLLMVGFVQSNPRFLSRIFSRKPDCHFGRRFPPLYLTTTSNFCRGRIILL